METVSRYLMDIGRLPEWVAGLDRVMLDPGEPVKPGHHHVCVFPGMELSISVDQVIQEDGEFTIMRLGQDKLYAMGETVPTDNSVGYAKGCIFIQTDGGDTTTFYINVGTALLSNFDAPLP